MIPYDVLCLSTGASYVSPWRANEDAFQTVQEKEQEFIEAHEKIKSSKSICCVGTGPTSLEVAGYLKESFPDKEVAVCCRGQTILAKYPGAHAAAIKILGKVGVTVLTGHPYKDGKVGGKDFDYILDCSGFKFTGPQKYMQGELANCLCKKTGQIMVNEFCQVTNKHPFVDNGVSSPQVYKNIFSYGDVCLTPADEPKQIVSMFQYGFQLANNIVQVADGTANFFPIPKHDEFHNMCMVPIGKKHGVLIFNKMVKEMGEDAHKGKMDLRNNTIGSLNGDLAAMQREAESGKQFGKFFDMANAKCCGCCIPIHISKVKER